MSRCLRKAPGRPQETRTEVGLDMGSHSVLKRLVGPGIMRCNRPQRTFGFVTAGWGVWRVLKRGEGAACPREAEGQPYAPAHRACDTAHVDARVKAPLAPPPWPCASGGHPQFFLTFPLTMLFTRRM